MLQLLAALGLALALLLGGNVTPDDNPGGPPVPKPSPNVQVAPATWPVTGSDNPGGPPVY